MGEALFPHLRTAFAQQQPRERHGSPGERAGSLRGGGAAGVLVGARWEAVRLLRGPGAGPCWRLPRQLPSASAS